MTDRFLPMELRFTWQQGRYCLVTLDERFVTVMNRDVHTPNEVRSVELALLSVAGIAGWKIAIEDEEDNSAENNRLSLVSPD